MTLENRLNMISYLHKAFMLTMLVIATIDFTACDNEKDTPAQKTQKILAAGPWQVERVTIDGIDQTQMFSGFELTFGSDNNYETQNGGVIWPASGRWSFAEADAKHIKFDDLLVSVIEVTDSSLVLELNWNSTTFRPGRSKSVHGLHVFRMHR